MKFIRIFIETTGESFHLLFLNKIYSRKKETFLNYIELKVYFIDE